MRNGNNKTDTRDELIKRFEKRADLAGLRNAIDATIQFSIKNKKSVSSR